MTITICFLAQVIAERSKAYSHGLTVCSVGYIYRIKAIDLKVMSFLGLEAWCTNCIVFMVYFKQYQRGGDLDLVFIQSDKLQMGHCNSDLPYCIRIFSLRYRPNVLNSVSWISGTW